MFLRHFYKHHKAWIQFPNNPFLNPPFGSNTPLFKNSIHCRPCTKVKAMDTIFNKSLVNPHFGSNTPFFKNHIHYHTPTKASPVPCRHQPVETIFKNRHFDPIFGSYNSFFIIISTAIPPPTPLEWKQFSKTAVLIQSLDQINHF